MISFINFPQDVKNNVISFLEEPELFSLSRTNSESNQRIWVPLKDKAFLKYIPQGVEKEAYMSKCGVKSTIELLNKIRRFIEGVKFGEPASFTCFFPFNPDNQLDIKFYEGKGTEEICIAMSGFSEKNEIVHYTKKNLLPPISYLNMQCTIKCQIQATYWLEELKKIFKEKVEEVELEQEKILSGTGGNSFNRKSSFDY